MAIIGFDSFARANQAAWGHATNGLVWSVARGSNSNYAIAANEGTISGTTSETASFLGNKTAANFDTSVHVSRAVSTASSTAILARASVANVGGSNVITGYKARLKSGNLDLVSEIGGASTVIATVPYTEVPGAYDFIHLTVVGNQLYANAWPDTVDEPTPPLIGPITDNTVTGIGQMGLSATLQPGDTAYFDTFSCDDLTLPPGPHADNPYGFTVLNRNPILQVVLSDIEASGAAWIRPQTNWEEMEVTDDGSRGSTLSSVINWAEMDNIVLRGNAQSLRICMVVQNPPPWHCNLVTSPANVNPIEIPALLDTIAFATAVITRYNGRTINAVTGNPYGTIQALMFNEDWDQYAAGWPGNGNPTYIGRDSTPLAPILQALYPIVKAQLPSCLVGCASLLGKRTDAAHINTWVSNLFATWNANGGNGAAFCDFLDLHYYPCGAPPSQPNPNNGDPSLIDRLSAMRSACVAYGHANMDIWMCEYSYQQGSSPPQVCDVSQSVQATNMLLTIQTAFQLGVTHLFWWTIGGNSNNSIVQGYGSNTVFLPAFYALQSQIIAQPNVPPTYHYPQDRVATIVRGNLGSATIIRDSGGTSI
jgi:hypothetical protein